MPDMSKIIHRVRIAHNDSRGIRTHDYTDSGPVSAGHLDAAGRAAAFAAAMRAYYRQSGRSHIVVGPYEVDLEGCPCGQVDLPPHTSDTHDEVVAVEWMATRD